MQQDSRPQEPFDGLSPAEAAARLAQVGPNVLPEPVPPTLPAIFLRQFLSPLIYILLAAALVSLALGDAGDALFIGLVLFFNGVIGTVQEYSAGRAAAALRGLAEQRALVVRGGERLEIDARQLVPGDVVVLEAGTRVPADLRLLQAWGLRCDESLLTGESAPVAKGVTEREGDPAGLAAAGSLVTRGRAIGRVVATGKATGMGRIAAELARRSLSEPPLMIRLRRFARVIALAVGLAIAALVVIGLLRAMPFGDLFLMAVGLAVAAIPEALPVAISVALAVGMRRMAKAHVILRNMPAIESLGSCTMIATDKTGTLTVNQLAVTDITLPDGSRFDCRLGEDLDSCEIRALEGADSRERIVSLLRAAALPNEGRILRTGNGWHGLGDTVDVALLAAAHGAGLAARHGPEAYPVVGRIPYEPDRKYAASFHDGGRCVRVFVKGAPETLIEMCDRMDEGDEARPIRRETLLRQKEEMTARGLRVLAFAEGEIAAEPDGRYGHAHLVDLVFLGMAGMQDPVRSEVPAAIEACHTAGIEVAMITGDDPGTAAVIARQAGLRFDDGEVVTGEEVRQAAEAGEAALDALTRKARIYARVDPAQKLSIVLSLARNGHFVAVTGDGVNDAPALKHAHVGVAMGRKGTDVARESADVILTDDNFASIVGGIREGRVAYANIRKVIFMQVSTGAAEMLLFLMAIPLGLPMPLLPVQLLWLNLVTNGIQDVALAAEKAEGDELRYPPRRPNEPIFDRLMIRRVLLSTAIMGLGGFGAFYWLLWQGHEVGEARNLLLLLFVLFENFQTLAARSEHRSVFSQPFSRNRLLVGGIVVSQLVHVLALYWSPLAGTLETAPVALPLWLGLIAIAAVLLAGMELDKWLAARRGERPGRDRS